MTAYALIFFVFSFRIFMFICFFKLFHSRFCFFCFFFKCLFVVMFVRQRERANISIEPSDVFKRLCEERKVDMDLEEVPNICSIYQNSIYSNK